MEETRDLTEKIGGMIAGFETVPSLKRTKDQAIADFSAFAAEQYGKLNPTLPVSASLDGYRKTLREGKERALARVRESYTQFQEDFES